MLGFRADAGSRRKRVLDHKERSANDAEHDSFANDPWILKLVSFTETLLAQSRVRIIGVCFGHQILGRALGARVGRSDDGWEIAVLPVELTARGKEVFQQDKLVSIEIACSTVVDFRFLLSLEWWMVKLTNVRQFTKCTKTSYSPIRLAWSPWAAVQGV